MGLILIFQYAILCTQLAEPLNLLQCLWSRNWITYL